MGIKNTGADIEKILSLFFARWYIFLIAVVLCVSTVLLYAFFIADEVYEAYTTMYVTETYEYEEKANTNDLAVNEKLAEDYKHIVVSNKVLDKVTEALPGISISRGNISVSALSKSRMLMLSVKNKDPHSAAAIANEITDVMIKEVNEIIRKDNIIIIDRAKIPTTPKSLDLKVYLVMAAVAGIILSAVAVIVIEAFDTKIKGPDDINEYFGEMPILALIPKYDNDVDSSERGEQQGEA